MLGWRYCVEPGCVGIYSPMSVVSAFSTDISDELKDERKTDARNPAIFTRQKRTWTEESSKNVC